MAGCQLTHQQHSLVRDGDLSEYVLRKQTDEQPQEGEQQNSCRDVLLFAFNLSDSFHQRWKCTRLHLQQQTGSQFNEKQGEPRGEDTQECLDRRFLARGSSLSEHLFD